MTGILFEFKSIKQAASSSAFNSDRSAIEMSASKSGGKLPLFFKSLKEKKQSGEIAFETGFYNEYAHATRARELPRAEYSYSAAPTPDCTLQCDLLLLLVCQQNATPECTSSTTITIKKPSHILS